MPQNIESHIRRQQSIQFVMGVQRGYLRRLPLSFPRRVLPLPAGCWTVGAFTSLQSNSRGGVGCSTKATVAVLLMTWLGTFLRTARNPHTLQSNWNWLACLSLDRMWDPLGSLAWHSPVVHRIRWPQGVGRSHATNLTDFTSLLSCLYERTAGE